MTRHNRLHEITIKKTVILLIVNPILCLNTAKTGLLKSYDQEISGFIDRNLVVNIKETELYPVSRLTSYSTRQKEIKAAIFSTPVSTLYSN